MTRRDRLKINRATGLKEVKEDLRALLKQNHTMQLKWLNKGADWMYQKSNPPSFTLDRISYTTRQSGAAPPAERWRA